MSCRICHDDEDTFDMFAPCDCKGSIALVHRKCLDEWRRTGVHHSTCDVCDFQYNLYCSWRSIIRYCLDFSFYPIFCILIVHGDRFEDMEYVFTLIMTYIMWGVKFMLLSCYVRYFVHPFAWSACVILLLYDTTLSIHAIMAGTLLNGWMFLLKHHVLNKREDMDKVLPRDTAVTGFTPVMLSVHHFIFHRVSQAVLKVIVKAYVYVIWLAFVILESLTNVVEYFLHK